MKRFAGRGGTPKQLAWRTEVPVTGDETQMRAKVTGQMLTAQRCVCVCVCDYEHIFISVCVCVCVCVCMYICEHQRDGLQRVEKVCVVCVFG